MGQNPNIDKLLPGNPYVPVISKKNSGGNGYSNHTEFLLKLRGEKRNSNGVQTIPFENKLMNFQNVPYEKHGSKPILSSNPRKEYFIQHENRNIPEKAFIQNMIERNKKINVLNEKVPKEVYKNMTNQDRTMQDERMNRTPTQSKRQLKEDIHYIDNTSYKPPVHFGKNPHQSSIIKKISNPERMQPSNIGHLDQSIHNDPYQIKNESNHIFSKNIIYSNKNLKMINSSKEYELQKKVHDVQLVNPKINSIRSNFINKNIYNPDIIINSFNNDNIPIFLSNKDRNEEYFDQTDENSKNFKSKAKNCPEIFYHNENFLEYDAPKSCRVADNTYQEINKQDFRQMKGNKYYY